MLAVEGGWSAAPAAPPQPVAALIGRDGDHRPDTTLAQVLANRAGGVRLIGQDHVRPGAWPSSPTRNAKAGHDVSEGGCVTGGEHEGQWPALGIGGQVDLCAQSAAGPADGVVWGFACWSPLFFAGPGRVLVCAHHGGVHRDSPVEVVIGVGLRDQRGEHPLPGAVDGPHPQPGVDASPVAVFLRQMNPLVPLVPRQATFALLWCDASPRYLAGWHGAGHLRRAAIQVQARALACYGFFDF